MKFIIDENLPPSLSKVIIELGYEAIHVNHCKLDGTPDFEILKYAKENDLVIITHDTDFGKLIAYHGFSDPSVILFRIELITLNNLSTLLGKFLNTVEKELKEGVIVIIDDKKIRIRKVTTTETQRIK